jgi:hypothetical protein
MYRASCIIAGSFYCEAQGIGFVISRILGGKKERAERGCGFVRVGLIVRALKARKI